MMGHILCQVKHGGGGVMVWARMATSGTGSVMFTGMNGTGLYCADIQPNATKVRMVLDDAD